MQTMKHNYDINDPDNVDLIDREAMDNMYSIITKQETYDTLMDRKGRVLMIFNPLEVTPTLDELIDDLIEYYSDSDIEMYERCAELLKMKNSDELNSFDFIPLDMDIDFEADFDIEDNDR